MAFLILYTVISELRREPSYQGKPLSVWIEDLHQTNDVKRREARDALVSMGDDAVRRLTQWVDQEDRGWRKETAKVLRSIAITRSWMASPELKRANAVLALGAIGPSAVAAVPSLVKATKDESWMIATRAEAALIQIRGDSVASLISTINKVSNSTNWLTAVSTLNALGSNMAPALADFPKQLREWDLPTRFGLVELLCTTHIEPDVAFPIILACLKDADLGLRANALNAALINCVHLNDNGIIHDKWGSTTTAAIAQCLYDTNKDVRLNALLSLRIIAGFKELDPATPGLRQALDQATNDPDVTVRSWALGFKTILK